MATDLLIYILSFVFIWLGSGLIIGSVDRFSKKLKLSSFTASFIILGILTSTPELAVGLTAVAQKDPGVFIGNLIGGIPVIFMLIIPLLAILGNGVSLDHSLSKNRLLIYLLIITSPSFFLLDQKITLIEGVIMIVLYIGLTFAIQMNRGIFDRKHTKTFNVKAYSYKDLVKILIGIGIVFVTSNIIVDKTILFSEVFNIPVFFISLIFISIGTNIPELSLAIRSVFLGKKEVALGDYMGSAATNTLLFGILTLLNGGEIISIENFHITFIFIALGLFLFFYFSLSRNTISRREGSMLIIIYMLFVIFEITR